MTFILLLTIWRDILALHFNRVALSLVKEAPKKGSKKDGDLGGPFLRLNRHE